MAINAIFACNGISESKENLMSETYTSIIMIVLYRDLAQRIAPGEWRTKLGRDIKVQFLSISCTCICMFLFSFSPCHGDIDYLMP